MVTLYPVSFLALLLLLQGPQEPQKDYHLIPGEAVPLPYDASRLAPWVSDFTSRMTAQVMMPGVTAPNPSDYRSLVQTVASPSIEDLQRENDELRLRLEKLEQMLRDDLSKPPVTGAQSEESKTDMMSVPGWMVEYHPWNKEGRLANDPQDVILTQNCPFTGGLGQTHPDDMKIYRFISTFRAKEAGRYAFAFDTTCGFGHPCTFKFSVNGQPVINFKGQTEKERLINGLPLVPGDHVLEFTIHLNSRYFVKYQPVESFRWYPMVKGPSDLKPRDFTLDELFSVIPRKEKMAAQACS